ncbi:glycoside hydrolase family 3 N-terminal domain-containing protein, partial [Shewanella algae]|uniref:glycoside hydrolase family 3 N-terminal domain-containing protein n=1 Tax=Shewanella algae TaxID=38313 RepID=UPI00313DEF9D
HPYLELEWTNRLQAQSKVPLMVAMDAELGIGMRLDSVTMFPHQLVMGALSDNSLIRQMGVEVGRQCRRMGIHVNFAP